MAEWTDRWVKTGPGAPPIKNPKHFSLSRSPPPLSLFLYRAHGGAWTELPAAGAPPATSHALHRGARRGPPSLPFLFHCHSLSIPWRGDTEKNRYPSCPLTPACSTAKDGGGWCALCPRKGSVLSAVAEACSSTALFFVLCLGMPMPTGSRGTAWPGMAAQLCR
jgi:hypothetical protein